MHIVVTHSEDPDALSAVDDLMAQADAKLEGQRPAGALLYAAVDFDHQTVLDGIQDRWPGLPLVGCTTDGEGSTCGRFAEDSLVLVLLAGKELQVTASCGRRLSEGLDESVDGAFGALEHGPAAPPLIVAVAESIGVSGASVVQALDRAKPEGSVVVGGTAGDQWRFEKSLQFFGREVMTDSLVLLGVGGPIHVSVGVQSGWQPMGKRMTVTKAAGNILFELDGQPAIEVFHSFFGEHVPPSPENPFAVFEGGDDRFYLRAPFPTIREDGAIVLAADIPEGAVVQVTEAGREQILDGARQAMRDAHDRYEGSDPQGVLFFSCAARKQVLGTRTAKEIGELEGASDQALDMAGFYTYGEIAPLTRGGEVRFHNETVVAALVGA